MNTKLNGVSPACIARDGQRKEVRFSEYSVLRYLKTTDPLKSKLLKLVVNASHPEYGSYFNASFAGHPSLHLNSPNEHATLPILLRYGFTIRPELQTLRLGSWADCERLLFFLFCPVPGTAGLLPSGRKVVSLREEL